jgi:serine/threonine protein phosphatase PrpC
MKRTLSFGAATQQGTWPVQEDGFYVDPVGQIYAVGDGFGGRGAGDLSVKLTLDELKRMGRKKIGKEFFSAMHFQLQKRNDASAVARRGACSVALVEIVEGTFYARQIGACGIFLFRAGNCLPILLPQSGVRQEFQPLLADSALGLPGDIFPEERIFPLESGDIVGIASSGLEWQSESFAQMVREQLTLRTPGEELSSMATHLVENAGLSSQGWNRTLVLLEKA